MNVKGFILFSIIIASVLFPLFITSYVSFPLTSFWFEGSAYYNATGSYIVLVPEATSQAGRAIPLMGLPSRYGWFNFSFQYYIRDTDNQRADGFTFAFFANLSSLTPISQATGGEEGFGTSKAYAIEFDEFQNTYDPTAPHIALINASYQNHVVYNSSVSFAFTPNIWHQCNVSIYYNGTYLEILVWVDNYVVLSYSVKNPVIYGYYVFFSAGTGGAADGFYIKNFEVAFSYIPARYSYLTEYLNSSYSWTENNFNIMYGVVGVKSYSWSENTFNIARGFISTAKYSWLENSFNKSEEILSSSTKVLFPISCKVVDLLSKSTVISPKASWLYTNVSYRLAVLVYSLKSCSNCLFRVIFESPFAKDIADNGTAYLALDNTSVSGSVYVLNNSVVVVYFRASLEAFTYHYLYIYFGKTSSPNVGINEIPIYVSTPDYVNTTLPIFLPKIIYDAYGTEVPGYVYLANGTRIGIAALMPGNTSAILILFSTAFPKGSYYIYVKFTNATQTTFQTPSGLLVPITIPTNSSQPTFFFDPLDSLNNWVTVGSGKLSLATSPVLVGSYSIKKDTYPDPNGGYEPLPQALNFAASPCYLLITYIYRSYIGAAADRVGLTDTSGNGYGFILTHSSPPTIGIDKRSSWSSTIEATRDISYNPINTWYQARLELCYVNGEMLVTASAITFNGSKIIGLVGYRDTSPYTNLDAFYILGGYTYYVDFVMVVPALGNASQTLIYDPALSIGSEPCSYVEKYVPPPPPPTTTTPMTIPQPSITVPSLTVTAPPLSFFKVEKPSLYSPIGLLILGFFIVIFIVYTRIFPWYKALVVSSAIMLIASIIWFGPIYMAIFLALLAVGLTLWKLWG